MADSGPQLRSPNRSIPLPQLIHCSVSFHLSWSRWVRVKIYSKSPGIISISKSIYWSWEWWRMVAIPASSGDWGRTIATGLRPTWTTQWIQGQHEPHGQTLSQNKARKKVFIRYLFVNHVDSNNISSLPLILYVTWRKSFHLLRTLKMG